jgi:hypothetical protein
LLPIRTPMRFALAHYTISGLMPTNRQTPQMQQ